MSRPEKFWPKRTNLQTQRRRNFSRVKIWQSRQRACLHGGGWGNSPWSQNKTRLHTILQTWSAGLRFLEVVVALAPSSRLEKDESLILGNVCIYLWKRHALCYAVLGYARNRWLNMLYGIVWETKYGRFTTLNIPKCEHFTHLVCPLRFLVISAIRRLGNVQSFKTYVFRFWAFCYESDPG